MTPQPGPPEPGLTTQEARKRLLEHGPNEVAPTRFASGLSQAKQVLLDPMGLMLLGLAALYLLLGDRTDALILLIAYVPITMVDVLLNLRAERALSALKQKLHPIAKVLRDHRIQEIPTRELVPGDLLLFEEGQALPADGTILEAENLNINEATLTGESLPVSKAEGKPFFSGTVTVTGRGVGVIEKTGRQTRLGGVARLLEKVEVATSPFQKQINALVGKVLLVAMGLVVLLFLLQLLKTRELIPSLIISLTLGMAFEPEVFPLVFTLYLSLGAWRLSRHGVLVKSLPSVETLGSVDIICTDKTGTLTEGHFQLEELWLLDPASEAEAAWRAALMACEIHPIDSLEAAIAHKASPYSGQLEGWELTWDYPFEPRGKHMSHVWRKQSSGRMIIVMKGAVEGILEHCEFSGPERDRIAEKVQELAGSGKRILGLAAREGLCTGVREQDERGMKLLGLLVFNDPIRPTVKQAIAECQAAGIEIKMLTGDHPYTAHAVADQAGIRHSHDALLTGEELARMSPEARRDAYLRGTIFARVLPEQKHEMIRALKDAGRVVAMTGDGINDAPALRLADIGISMGANATDVARSAAQMVLLGNDFSGIVQAVFEGRRIFSNLRRSFSYLIAFPIPVVALALIPPMLNWTPILLPVHIIILELIVHPISAFTFENLADPRTWSRAGRTEGLISRNQLLRALFSGVLLSVGALAMFGFLKASFPAAQARSASFAVVLLGNVSLVLLGSWSWLHRRFLVTAALLVAITLACTRIPGLSRLLHLEPISLPTLGLAAAVSAIALLGWVFREDRQIRG